MSLFGRIGPRHRFVGGASQHDAYIADLPSRPLSERGELSKTIPPIAERPMIFISEEEFNDPALFFKNWWE